MQFQTIQYLVFLVIVFTIYWAFHRHRKGQNLIILAASYLFYGWWDWRFLFLIAALSAFSFVSGLLIHRYALQQRSKASHIVSIIAMVVSITILGIFKYFDFFSQELQQQLAHFGLHADLPTLNLILPVGISFYTFQALSYTLDIYRRQLEPTPYVVEYFAYISFFPQLVAGPIERAAHLLPQFQQARIFSYNLAADGGRQILWGFFKKLVVADSCALYVDMVHANHTLHSAPTLWLAAILFAIQIYGDFSGYSDIAIGSAKLFGFKLRSNFHTPFFSRNIAEFWHRWHISLTSWFRDYIYIPLGGSRVSRIKVVRNTFIVFLVSGLWHGARTTFVVWGLYHAILFLPLIILNSRRQPIEADSHHIIPTLRELFQMAKTFVLVVIGFVIFRSDYMVNALSYIRAMVLDWRCLCPAPLPNGAGAVPIAIALLVVVDWLGRDYEHPLQILANRPAWLRWLCYALLLPGIIYGFSISYYQPSQFIYFQF